MGPLKGEATHSTTAHCHASTKTQDLKRNIYMVEGIICILL